MSAKTATPTPALSFPRPIFAALSPHPFLQAHLRSATTTKAPARANGRTAQEFRALGVNTGSLTHCNGSAVVRSGNTSVVCGVRAEILRREDVVGAGEYKAQNTSPPPKTQNGEDEEDGDEDEEDEIEKLRLLVPNIELSTGSTPHHLPGSAPTTSAQTLVSRIRALLLSSRLLRASDLSIVYAPPLNAEDPAAAPEDEVKAYWVLYMDVFFISLDGNAFDAAWMAVLAALRDTLIPRAFWDEELDMVLCADEVGAARRLRLRGLPVPCTFAVFEGRKEDGAADEEDRNTDWVLSDPDAFEEGVCRESVCVVVDCKGGKGTQVRKIEKSGGGVVDRAVMKGLVARSSERWAVWDEVLRGRA